MKNSLKILFSTAALFASISFISCANEETESIENISIEEIYGYTYAGKINASSGNKLTPSIIIFNSNRLDWNMNTSGMESNQFFYTSEKNGKNRYILYWYTSESLMNINNTDKAAMTVMLGINSRQEIVVLLKDGDPAIGSGNKMAGTRVGMTITNAEKNTEPTVIKDQLIIPDVEITVIGTAAQWYEENTLLNGEIAYRVIEPNTKNLLVSGKGSSGKDSDGNEVTPTATIKRTEANTVSVIIPRLLYGTMDMKGFEVKNVQITKDSDKYFLSKDEFTAVTTDNLSINGKSLKGHFENGNLLLRVEFYPGAMPLPVIFIFKTK